MTKRIVALMLSLWMLVLTVGCASAETEKPDLLGDFTTTDIYGNPVDQSLIRDAKLTFVNVWATYCGPCIREMPDLGALAAEYEGRVQFIGIVSDANMGSGPMTDIVDLAKQIVEETGAGTYTHLIAPDSWLRGFLGSVQVVPTSFFVDSEGRQVSYAYESSQSADDWRKAIDAALLELA